MMILAVERTDGLNSDAELIEALECLLDFTETIAHPAKGDRLSEPLWPLRCTRSASLCISQANRASSVSSLSFRNVFV